MQLNVDSLKGTKGASKNFRLEEEVPPLDSRDRSIELVEPVMVEGTVTNVGSGMLVQGQIHSQVVLPCSRCLKPHRIQIDPQFAEEYTEDLQAAAKNTVDGMHTYRGSLVEIGNEVREQILLNIPMRTLCSLDCRGICPRCGADLNETTCSCQEEEADQRLDALKKWFEK